MKKLPLTNIEKFKKARNIPWPPNSEVFWCGRYTHHDLRKTYLQEGIVIIWEGNPFELDINFDYILEK